MIKTIGSFLAIIMLVSCGKDDIPAENFVFDLEDEFKIFLKEDLSTADSRQLLLDIASIREFNCENYQLGSTLSIFGGQRIRITVKELISPNICIEGIDHAYANFSLGNLEQRDYLFNVTLINQIENEGILSVYPDYYEIDIKEENGISLPQPRLYRLPEQCIWGYIGYDQDITVANELMTDMLEILEIGDFYKGNYGHFIYNEAGVVELPGEDIEAANTLTFFLGLNTSTDDLRDKVEVEYCPLYKDKVDLKIYASDGTVIECF